MTADELKCEFFDLQMEHQKQTIIIDQLQKRMADIIKEVKEIENAAGNSEGTVEKA